MDKRSYTNLPTTENITKPKFMGFLEAILENLINLGTTIESIETAFDVQNASGNQLDVVGELVGLQRLLPYVPATGTRLMDDDEYRLALQMKIARNEWDGTNGSAIEILQKYLTGDISVSYIDGQDSTVEYKIVGAISTRQAEILNATGLLLVPSGTSSVVTTDLGNIYVNISSGMCVTGMEVVSSVNMI